MVTTGITSGRRTVMNISRWGITKVWKGICRLCRVPKKCFWANLDYFKVVLSHLKFGKKFGFFFGFSAEKGSKWPSIVPFKLKKGRKIHFGPNSPIRKVGLANLDAFCTLFHSLTPKTKEFRGDKFGTNRTFWRFLLLHTVGHYCCWKVLGVHCELYKALMLTV